MSAAAWRSASCRRASASRAAQEHLARVLELAGDDRPGDGEPRGRVGVCLMLGVAEQDVPAPRAVEAADELAAA